MYGPKTRKIKRPKRVKFCWVNRAKFKAHRRAFTPTCCTGLSGLATPLSFENPLPLLMLKPLLLSASGWAV